MVEFCFLNQGRRGCNKTKMSVNRERQKKIKSRKKMMEQNQDECRQREG